jgi:hypothetical protein
MNHEKLLHHFCFFIAKLQKHFWIFLNFKLIFDVLELLFYIDVKNKF